MPTSATNRPAAIFSQLGGPLNARLKLTATDSRQAAQYRKLAQAISQQTQNAGNQVIAVVDADAPAQTGETLCLLGAALAAQESGEVLLVDMNPADPSLSRGFAAGAKSGLIEVFNLRKSWRELTLAAGPLRLALLPAGRGVLADPQAAGRSVADLVTQWKARYRYTLLDVGSAGAPLFRTALKQCDVCYLQVRVGEAEIARTSASVKHLKRCGVRLAGCIAVEPAQLV